MVATETIILGWIEISHQYITTLLLFLCFQFAKFNKTKKITEGSRIWARHLVYVVSVPGLVVGSLYFDMKKYVFTIMDMNIINVSLLISQPTIVYSKINDWTYNVL